MSIKSKIATNVEVDANGCWLWQKSKMGSGYAQVCYPGGKGLGHRLAYEAWVGPIPEGQEIDHLCRVRHCVNPSHLQAVTHRENMRRSDTEMGRNARKTQCQAGHALEGSNLITRGGKQRLCRECSNAYARDRKARLRREKAT